MKNTSIIIYGAYDRHNYGDLLFPLILKHKIENEFKLKTIIASTSKSDLSNYGALPTIHLKEAIEKTKHQQKTKLIIAGGEVLTANWESIIGYISPKILYYPIKLVPKIIGPKYTSTISQKLTGISSSTPFIIGQDKYPGIEVFYNAVGGNEISRKANFIKKEIKSNLSNSTQITVRDLTTSAELKKLELQHDLSPDCAVLISEIYPNETASQNQYIAFHISAHHARGRISEIAEQLIKIHESTGHKIALLTIGKAPGHSDDAPLDKIHSRIPNISFRIKSGKIEDIIKCISSSKAYCGSSLHGAITAMAYLVPQAALFPHKIIKLSSYLETWSTEDSYVLTEASEISQKLLTLLNNFGDKEKSALRKNVLKLQSIANEKIHQILEM
ncbi:polysaccharide pyruvyl transferase CsaB [compost metagenome]